MNIENPIIRRAQKKDGQQLANLATIGFPGYPFTGVYQEKSVLKEIAQGEHRIVIIDHEDLIGTAVLGIEPPMAEIKRVLVNPALRKNGLAKLLTIKLTEDASGLGLIPWLDARADQPGMQKAALASGLQPICLESGKHIVYQHQDNQGLSIGPARETMVHMTSLNLCLCNLATILKFWPHERREKLINNLVGSFILPPKDVPRACQVLPNANIVAENIQAGLDQWKNYFIVNELSSDICGIEMKESQIMIIKPDASGFINKVGKQDLDSLLQIANTLGLQIITIYVDANDFEQTDLVDFAGMQPAMIRPWKKDKFSDSQWQIGWRMTMNDYSSCLHHLNLDLKIEAQIKTLISQLGNWIL